MADLAKLCFRCRCFAEDKSCCVCGKVLGTNRLGRVPIARSMQEGFPSGCFSFPFRVSFRIFIHKFLGHYSGTNCSCALWQSFHVQTAGGSLNLTAQHLYSARSTACFDRPEEVWKGSAVLSVVFRIASNLGFDLCIILHVWQSVWISNCRISTLGLADSDQSGI